MIMKWITPLIDHPVDGYRFVCYFLKEVIAISNMTGRFMGYPLETAMRPVIRARLTTSLCSTYISVAALLFFGDSRFFLKIFFCISPHSRCKPC